MFWWVFGATDGIRSGCLMWCQVGGWVGGPASVRGVGRAARAGPRQVLGRFVPGSVPVVLALKTHGQSGAALGCRGGRGRVPGLGERTRPAPRESPEQGEQSF